VPPEHRPRGRLTKFASGVSCLFRGLADLATCPGMWPWALLPLVLNLLVFSLVLVAAVWAAAHYASGLSESGWGVLWGSLAGLAAFALVLLLSFFTFGLVAPVLAAPFNEMLSQQAERRLTGSTGELKDRPLATELLRAAWSATKLFLLEVAVVFPALLLLLIPFAGVVLFAIPAGLFIALAYLDYPLDRRKLGVRQKLAFCRRHAAEVMGFGLTAYLVMMVPFLNVLMIPVAAVAGARLFVDLTREEARRGYPPPPGAGKTEAPSSAAAPEPASDSEAEAE
jgi:CysZ protein